MQGRYWSSSKSVGPSWSENGPERAFLVLFDVDGTLLDVGTLISDAMIQSFLAAGEVPPNASTVHDIIGLSDPEIVNYLAADLSPDRRAKIMAGYRLRYFDAMDSCDDFPVFMGVDAALGRLRQSGVALGLATGKSDRGVAQLLGAMGWTSHFRSVQTADRNPSKPDPTMVNKAMAEVGLTAAQTVLVGDTRYDMRMAKAAGVRAVGVSWGYNPPEELRREGAVAIARDFAHLTDILLAMSEDAQPPKMINQVDESAAG